MIRLKWNILMINKFVFISFVALVFNSLDCTEKRYKLYCFYTPLYKSVYENYFLPSIKDDFEVITKIFDQECPSGRYFSEGWERVTIHKLYMLRDAIYEHIDQKVFFYSDIDIIFLRPVIDLCLQHLQDHDFVIQEGWPSGKLCSGFMAIKGSKRTLNLIEVALDLMENKNCKDDQVALRKAVQLISSDQLSWDLLPSNLFPNGFRVMKNCYAIKKYYTKNAQIEFEFDDSVALFHANCCIGIENKIDLINEFQEKFKEKMDVNK